MTRSPTRLRTRTAARGYSLLAVLFVITMLALMGTAAYTLATSDASTADASELRSQALSAAESGLQIYSATMDPAMVVDQTGNVNDLEPVEIAGTGRTQYRFLIIGAGSTGTIGDVISEGQVVRDGRVISRARIRGSVMMQAFVDPYSESAGGGPSGANLNRTGIRPPFAGGPSL